MIEDLKRESARLRQEQDRSRRRERRRVVDTYTARHSRNTHQVSSQTAELDRTHSSHYLMNQQATRVANGPAPAGNRSQPHERHRLHVTPSSRTSLDRRLLWAPDNNRTGWQSRWTSRANSRTLPVLSISAVVDAIASWPTDDPVLPLPEGGFCEALRCILPVGHTSPHETLDPCPEAGCSLHVRHVIPHNFEDLRSPAERAEKAAMEVAAEFMKTSLMVLSAMAVARLPAETQDRSESLVTVSSRNTRDKLFVADANTSTSAPPELTNRLTLRSQQIRLFSLCPEEGRSEVRGSLQIVELSKCPKYIALSYMWGDQTERRAVWINDTGTVPVGLNLWQFLRMQASAITQPTLFWD